MLNYYDSRLVASGYCGLFNPMTLQPVSTYYALAAFGELYVLGQQAQCDVAEEDVYAVAATDGEKKAVLIANHSEQNKSLEIGLDDSFAVYLLEQDVFLEKTEQRADVLEMKPNQVVLIKNY